MTVKHADTDRVVEMVRCAAEADADPGAMVGLLTARLRKADSLLSECVEHVPDGLAGRIVEFAGGV